MQTGNLRRGYARRQKVRALMKKKIVVRYFFQKGPTHGAQYVQWTVLLFHTLRPPTPFRGLLFVSICEGENDRFGAPFVSFGVGHTLKLRLMGLTDG